MKTNVIFFLIILLSTSLCNAEPQSKMLHFLPSILAATTITQIDPVITPHEIHPLELSYGILSACAPGHLTYSSQTITLSNRYPSNVTVVKMEIIDPDIFKFDEQNSLPVTLAPNDKITYFTSRINSILCDDITGPAKIVKFVFSSGDYQLY
ncbi:MAG: hypothetical protein ACYDBT_15830 [Desulfobulbaceae bacterium]